jgi:hypothetical protein
MNTFIRKMFFFISLLFGIFFCFIFITIISFKRVEAMSFKISGDTIIVGHSMPACAIDDSKLTGCFNWSDSGEGHYISYYKIRHLLQKNKHIKYVVCSFSPWGDGDIVNLEKDYCFGLGPVLPFLCLSDLSDLPYFRPLAWEKALREYWTIQLRHLFVPIPLKCWGHYQRQEKCEVDRDAKSKERALINKKNFRPSRYIRSIQILCESHGAKMILLQTPVYDKKKWFPDVSWIIDQWYPDIEYWDYSEMEFPKDYFSDINHLNIKGAQIFTKMFETRLNELKTRDLLLKERGSIDLPAKMEN